MQDSTPKVKRSGRPNDIKFTLLLVAAGIVLTRGRPRGLPLPHHRTYGSVSGGSAD
jgi:hypothetical protein